MVRDAQLGGDPRLRPAPSCRGAALASRPCARERSDAAHGREDILKRWQRARDNGLSAAAVGVSRATLGGTFVIAGASRRSHDAPTRQPAWSPTLAKAVHDMRADCAVQGQTHRCDDGGVCESAAARILKRLVEKGTVAPVSTLRRKAPRAAADRLPRGRKPTDLGEILDILPLTLDSGRPPPSSTATSNATTAPDATSSTPSDHAMHSTDKPPTSTFNH